jgi:hypothetical protein
MKNAKKILVATASSEFFILRRGRSQTQTAFCRDCGAETPMLDFDSAVTVSHLGGRRLIGHIEAGVVHSIETTGGYLLVCQNSLQKFLQQGE